LSLASSTVVPFPRSVVIAICLTLYAVHFIEILSGHVEHQLELLLRDPKSGQLDVTCGAQGPGTGAVAFPSAHQSLSLVIS